MSLSQQFEISSPMKTKSEHASNGQGHASSIWNHFETVFSRSHSALKACAYVLLTTLLAIVVVSNSFKQFFQRFEGSWGNWDGFYQWIFSYNLSEFGVYMTVCASIVFIIYGGLGALFIWCDLSPNNPLLQYKIQPHRNVPLDRQLLNKCIRVVLFNHAFVSTPLVMVFFGLFKLRGNPMSLPLPPFEEAFVDFACFLIIEELFFYYSHRMMHLPQFYRRFHKKHHEFTAPIAIAAIYCHPVEHLLVNLIPIFLGPLIMKSHIALVWAWISIVITNTMLVHSGYHLPFMPSSESHDFHHNQFNYNFGVTGILDWLHGTDSAFRKSDYYRNHKTFFSLNSYDPVKPGLATPSNKTPKSSS